MCVLFLLYVFKAEKTSVLRDNVVPLYIYIDNDLIKEKKNILEEKSDGADQ